MCPLDAEMDFLLIRHKDECGLFYDWGGRNRFDIRKRVLMGLAGCGVLGAHRPNDFHDFSEYFVLEVYFLKHLVSLI